MTEINVTLSAEQVALLNKLLTPYVELYQNINTSFQRSTVISKRPDEDELKEIETRC